ncbi:hypothetical protein [Herbidospora daliensis]|uniref:hypothetical protein n=1 Tax=Herbidospora daliensis TaxID=295585 RepID=UPI0007804B38|nr:hypothetical protein [Herbidospora daliensis]
MHTIYLELGKKRVFANSVDWPGWSRSAKTEDDAIEALLSYEERYRVVADRAGLVFEPGEIRVAEKITGDSTTDFGAPSVPAVLDAEPWGVAEAAKNAALMTAAWEVFDAVVGITPEELRKGPRGGGRDRDKMVAHVVNAERAYAAKLDVRIRPGEVAGMRPRLLEVVSRPLDGDDYRWPVRYASRRIIWHVLDHVWEMEDRTERQ